MSNEFQQTKRPREPSFQYANKPQPSFQHVNKNQRINHVDDTEDIYSIHENSMDNNYDSETTEEQAIVTKEESVFLDE